MTKIIAGILLFVSLFTFATALGFEVLYHDTYNVPAGEYLFKIIKVNKPADAKSESHFFLIGEAHANDDFNLYILDAEQYEILTSGEVPETAVFWWTGEYTHIADKKIIVDCLNPGASESDDASERILLPLNYEEKYYVVLDNSFSKTKDKSITLLLVMLYYDYLAYGG